MALVIEISLGLPYLTMISKEKQVDSGSSCKIIPLCEWPNIVTLFESTWIVLFLWPSMMVKFSSNLDFLVYLDAGDEQIRV